MTLLRTIRRREQRKRARLRPKSTSIPFLTADWITRDTVRILTERMRIADMFNRQY